MTKKEMDKLRSSTLYEGEKLKVIYNGKLSNFPKNTIIEAYPRYVRPSGLPYPQPKWIVCSYYVDDLDGDMFPVADTRYGKLKNGFKWVID